MIEEFVPRSELIEAQRALTASAAENLRIWAWFLYRTRGTYRNGKYLESECRCPGGSPRCNDCIRSAALRGDQPPMGD